MDYKGATAMIESYLYLVYGRNIIVSFELILDRIIGRSEVIREGWYRL